MKLDGLHSPNSEQALGCIERKSTVARKAIVVERHTFGCGSRRKAFAGGV
jgi:hypothetical protein